MRAPPLLLAAGLLFWGWQSAHPAIAAALAVTLEVWRWIRWRWAIDDADFHRVSDFSSVALAVVAVYQFNEHGLHGIFDILAWTPVILWPLTALQLYSAGGQVPLTALFISARRQARADPTWPVGVLDLSYPYFLACMLAASTGEDHGFAFYGPLCLMLAFGLWPWKPRGYQPARWLGLWLAACVLGFALQAGMRGIQAYMENLVLGWLQDRPWSDPNPDRAMTAIGSIGRLKFSDRIRLWIRTDAPLAAPLLLKEASYDIYQFGIWKTAEPRFDVVEARPAIRTWALQAGTVAHALRIGTYFTKEIGVVPVPAGAVQIRGNQILDVQTNRNGAIEIESRPGYLDYTVGYRQAAWLAAPPTGADLAVPAAYDRDLETIAGSLHLAQKSPTEVLAALHRFFRDHFRYSMVQRGTFPWAHPLSDFLLHRRAGHCEYFATATVLLLRKAGIPARYAVGYSVSEYSVLQGQYIARSRDAHAWAEAYIGGRWLTVDNTPPYWRREEDGRASAWQSLSDIRSWLAYTFGHWREGDGVNNALLLWALVPLSGLLLWRLRQRRRIQVTAATPPRGTTPLHGGDSEILALLDALPDPGSRPRPGETVTGWWRRLHRGRGGDDRWVAELLRLHYRYRFDPDGLKPAERRALRAGASRLAAEIGAAG